MARPAIPTGAGHTQSGNTGFRRLRALRLLAPAVLLTLAACRDGPNTAPTTPAPPRPLAWSDAPRRLVVAAGETERFTASLTVAISATYEITSSGPNVAVTGETSAPGTFRGTVVGIEPGSARITISATAPGYTRAVRVIEVEVERDRSHLLDPRFQRSFWNELVFDAHDCPDADACPDYFTDGDPIQPLASRHLYVLPSTSPNIYLRTRTPTGLEGFSTAQLRRLRHIIPEAITLLTGTLFRGQIEEGDEGRDRDGWIAIEPVRIADDPETWGWRPDGWITCGRARTGWDNGRIRLNLDAVASSRIDGCEFDGLVRHEIGHALGFFHVGSDLHVMALASQQTSYSASERYHARLAYTFARGTRYLDAARVTGGKRDPERPQPRRRGPIISCGTRHTR